jgi:sarcosine oxidase subunit gamma
MSDSTTRRHGLEAFLSSSPAETGGGVRIEIRADLGHINLRGNPADPDFLAIIASVLGQELPIAANTMTTGDHRAYWLGPDEWQIVTEFDAARGLETKLSNALTDHHASVSDLSGGQIAFHVSGPGVRDVLAKGCTLDLAQGKFDVGDCAQSGLAKANALIGLIDDAGTVFEIVARRSFSDYALRWLTHAASEYGVSISASN